MNIIKKWAEEYLAVAKDMQKRINELKKLLLNASWNESEMIRARINIFYASYTDCTDTARELLKHADIAKYRQSAEKQDNYNCTLYIDTL